MGRAREEGNAGGDDDGRRGGFRQTRVAISTLGRRGDGAGGSGEHRLGYAVLGGASRGSGRLGIEEIFGIRRGGSRGVFFRGVSRVRFREEFRRDREIPSVFGGPRVGSPGRAKRESERSQFQRDRDREGEIAVEGTCRGSERDGDANEPRPANPAFATNLMSLTRFQEELHDAEFMFALVGREVVEEGVMS
ncbi:hypothetical protein CRG98_042366, partial [Punica granatum]